MRMRNLGLGSLAALVLVWGAGCKKSPSEAGQRPSSSTNAPATAADAASPTLARVHWLGKKHLAAHATSSYLLNAWNLPQAARLEAQTLDKLALALTGERPTAVSNQLPATASQPGVTHPPAQSLPTNQPAVSQLSTTNYPLSSKLRPLLDDLVREEWYLEIQQPPKQAGELVLAVRLDDQRAELWTSNLTAVLGAVTNAHSLPSPASRLAWRLPLAPRPSSPAPPPSRLDLARAGDWTLLGVAGETNALLAELIHRVRAEHTPVTASAFQVDPITRKLPPGSRATTNDWLEADVDLRRVSSALSLGWQLPEAWPRIAATWSGVGQYVRTGGKLTFAQPLNLDLEPWNIPTNLVREPLVSFSAVRGVRGWLAGQSWLRQLQIEPVPNQLCFWASSVTPAPIFAAVPLTNATVLLQAMGPRVAAQYAPWFTNHTIGELQFSKEPLSLCLSGIPMFEPELEAVATPGGSFLLGRVTPKLPETSKPAPPQLFAQLTARSNVVYYGWEMTHDKVAQWIYLGQTARLALLLPQFPPESAAYTLLLEVGPKLGNSGTEVLQDSPTSLSFVRNSHLGFTGVELHLLADWLESPAFPRGFYSLLAPKPAKRAPRNPFSTNSISPLRPPAKQLTNSVAR
jgi:hypothetical protein